MSKELSILDFTYREQLLFKALSGKPRTRLELLKVMPVSYIRLLNKKGIMVPQPGPCGIPRYVFRDGFIDGQTRT